MKPNSADWCILRCSGANTLKLAESLTAAGFDVWTPVEEVGRRERNRRGKRRDTLPVMPSYIFARAAHLLDLLALSKPETNPNRGFSVFRHNDRFPMIADEDLDPLRVAERKRQPFDKIARFSKGEMVRLMEGGFAGLTGVVELNKGQFTLVTFPGFPMPIKIKSLLLKSDIPQALAKAA